MQGLWEGTWRRDSTCWRLSRTDSTKGAAQQGPVPAPQWREGLEPSGALAWPAVGETQHVPKGLSLPGFVYLFSSKQGWKWLINTPPTPPHC